MRIEHRGEPLAGDDARAAEAVEAGHLDVEDHEVGLRAHELDGLVAPARLADDLVPSSSRISFRSRRMIASSSAITTRVGRLRGTAAPLGVESSADIRSSRSSCSLLRARSGRSGASRGGGHRVGVRRASRASTSLNGVSDHERPEARVLGLALEEGDLLVR